MAALFSDEELIPWLGEWQNMPEYECKDLLPKFQVLVSFECAADVEAFALALGVPIVANEQWKQLKSTWYPSREKSTLINLRYVEPTR